MREIKFRFWMGNYAKPIYEYSDNLIKLEQERDCQILAGYLMTKRAKIVKEQFTGLKDKNGVEIYEGDVVEVEEKEYQYNEVMINKYQTTVVFREGCFKLVEENGLMDMIYTKADKCKVIGNIHDKDNK